MSSSETTGPTQRSVRRPSWRRRVIATALGVGLLFAAGWTIAWQLLAMRAEASVEAWVSERRALGDRIQHGPVRVGGFPLTVEIQTREVHWVREDGVTLLTAAAPDVIASAPVWNPFRLTLRPTSGGRASVAGAWGSITGDADMAAAVVTLSRQGPERIELTLRNLDLIGPGGAMLARIDALDASIDPAPARNPGDSAETLYIRHDLVGMFRRRHLGIGPGDLAIRPDQYRHPGGFFRIGSGRRAIGDGSRFPGIAQQVIWKVELVQERAVGVR